MPTIQLRDPSLQQLVNHIVQNGGKITSQAVSTLIDAAYANDNRLSQAERSSLQELLHRYSDVLESPEAQQKLRNFTAMTNSDIRDAAHRFATDGSISLQEARSLENIARRDGQISGREKITLKALLGYYAPQMEPGAQELLTRVSGSSSTTPTTPTTPITPAESVVLGTPSGRNNEVLLGADGQFTLRQPSQAGGTLTQQASEAVYAAAELIDSQPAGKNLFANLSVAQKGAIAENLRNHVQQAFADADPANTGNMRMRAGAATTLVELAESAKTPEEKELRTQIMDQLLQQLEREPVRGMRRHLLNNLESRPELLSPSQQKTLDGLHNKIVPQQPPYEKWFANGNDTVQIKQYLHSEFYDETIREYEKNGFTKETGQSNVWVRTYEDPSGQHDPMKVRVTIEQKNMPVFTEMDDTDKNIIFYSGHSNLGGHTKNALAWSNGTKSTEDKLILMSLCRGNQMAAAVSNRFPNDHQITTNDSVNSRDEFETIFPMFEIMARRGSYSDMYKASEYSSWSDPQRAAYVFPHDTRQYNRLSDVDGDGVADAWGKNTDRLFNVDLTSPTGGQMDLKPTTTSPPARDLDGSKLISGIEFANTIIHYHMENWNRDTPFRKADDEKLVPAGWFDSSGSEPIRILEEQHDGSTYYRVQVNSRYANQSEEALGALVGYEIANYLDTKHSGSVDRKGMMTNFYLANEYLYFMGGNDYNSNTISKNLVSRYHFPEGLDFQDHQTAHRSSTDHNIADDNRINHLINKFPDWINGQ